MENAAKARGQTPSRGMRMNLSGGACSNCGRRARQAGAESAWNQAFPLQSRAPEENQNMEVKQLYVDEEVGGEPARCDRLYIQRNGAIDARARARAVGQGLAAAG